MAKKLGCSRQNIGYHLKNTFNLIKRKKPRCHALNDKQIEKRRVRAMALYKSLNNGKWQKYITTDEAWFYLSNCNGKRGIQYVSRSEKNPKIEVNERKQLHSKGFMVWAGVSFNGKTRLHFIEPGAKINSRYYIDNVLKKFLIRDAKRLYPNNNFIFHHDSAPSHVSKLTQEFMHANMKFLEKDNWIPMSPDAAPMDYFVWGYLKRKLWRVKVKDMAGLKRALKKAWRELPQNLINKALESWPRRVLKIYQAKGHQIEGIL